MQYLNIKKGIFQSRPNRFIAEVERNGIVERCHVKNTGRCKELLVPGATVYLNEAPLATKRKTRYDLIAVEKGNLLINMDAQAPNAVFGEYVAEEKFLSSITLIRPEYRYGDSRFDFYIEQGEQRHLVEVKGVTLEENGIARFPDAPTERGIKHINGLIAARDQGFETWICFVIQMEGMSWFEPNDSTHPAFGEALRAAQAAGVHVIALECHVTPDTLELTTPVPVRLERG